MKEKYPIQEVEIGLNTAQKKLYYIDTDNLIENGNFAYKIEIPTAIDYETLYFEDYKNASKYLKNYE